jgi:hypothetical protein
MGSNEHNSGTLQSLFDRRAAPPLAQQLADIAALWERARGRHVTALFGCSCGAPAAHVSAADFELDLIEFILARYAAVSEAGTFLQGLERRDIAGLLAALVSLDPAPAFAGEIAADLSRSIGSFAGRGRGVATYGR